MSVYRSPHPAFDIPDLPLADFVLARAAERAATAPRSSTASPDAPSPTRSCPAWSIAPRPRSRVAGCARGTSAPSSAPTRRSTRSRCSRSRGSARSSRPRARCTRATTWSSSCRTPARGSSSPLPRSQAPRSTRPPPQAPSTSCSRSARWTARDTVRRAARGARHAAAGRYRPHGRRRAPLLERHDGAAERRDADASQPGREHPAGRRRRDTCATATTRSSASCRSSTSTACRDDAARPVVGRDAGRDAAVRARAVPRSRRAVSRHRAARRAADCSGAGQESARDGRDLSHVRKLFSGAAPLGADVIGQCTARVGCVLQQGYGMTEAEPRHALHDGGSRDEQAGSIGVPVPLTECRVVDPTTGTDVAPGAGRRAVDARTAGDARLLQSSGGDARDGRRGRLAAHRRHRPRRRSTATSSSSIG